MSDRKTKQAGQPEPVAGGGGNAPAVRYRVNGTITVTGRTYHAGDTLETADDLAEALEMRLVETVEG